MARPRRRWRLSVLSMAACALSWVACGDVVRHRDACSMVGLDAAAPPDALEAGVDADLPFACAAPLPVEPCNPHAGIPECDRWAAYHGAGLVDPAAVCVQGGGPGDNCARADSCAGDIDTCRCGSGPRCVLGQVCARPCPGAERRCLACTQ